MKRNFGRSIDVLRQIVAFTNEFFEKEGTDPSVRYIVDLAIEELFTNMVKYNQETDSDITIDINAADGGVEVSLTDYGVEPFDPREAADVNIDAPLEDRSERGLGLYLVLKMVDSIQYQYRDRQSAITFTKRAT